MIHFKASFLVSSDSKLGEKDLRGIYAPYSFNANISLLAITVRTASVQLRGNIPGKVPSVMMYGVCMSSHVRCMAKLIGLSGQLPRTLQVGQSYLFGVRLMILESVQPIEGCAWQLAVEIFLVRTSCLYRDEDSNYQLCYRQIG